MNPNTNMPFNDQMDDQNEKTFRDYLSLFKLNFTPIFLISFTGLLVAIVYAVTAPNVYKSNTELKIAKTSGNILQGSMLPEFQGLNQDRFVMNEIEVLKSYRVRYKTAQLLTDSLQQSKFKGKLSPLLEEPVNFNSNNHKLKSLQDISTALFENVTIDQKRGLDIVEISVESVSPVEASLIVNCYSKAYYETNLSYNASS